MNILSIRPAASMLQSTFNRFANEIALRIFNSDEPAFQSLLQRWIIILLVVTFLCFLVGEITRNYSQTDKLWSLMPFLYSMITVASFPISPRLWLMTVMVVLWGIRLSYNFYRKGGYSLIPWKGEEDYRWKVVRQNPKLKARWRFALFNLFFISFYQHLLILLFSSPLLLAARYAGTNLSLTDFLAASCMLLFILLEAFADNQQYSFQLMKQGKYSGNSRFTGSLEKGFLSEGLWSYARHPNFTSEQAIWVSFYLFGTAASGRWLNLTIIGPVLLILLFAGSSALTENISREKYTDYEVYQQTVPRFIPAFIRRKKS
jgi:steroid 5-alpha reductase family enzyme